MDKARILIADDDLTARLLMRAALEQNGFQVTEAADGDQALESAESAPPDLVLLDVEMPGQDGFSVCQALRRRRGDELPIIMVTGMDDMPSIERAYQSGATDFIAKPINWTLIGHRVRYVLRAYQNLLALHDAQSQNLAMLRAIPDMLFRVDRSGRVLDVHGGNMTVGGAGDLPQAGRSVTDCLPEAVALRLMELARQAANTGEIQIHDYTLPDQAGVDRHYESRITQCGDAGEVLCLMRDVTLNKQAEGALRQSEAKLRQAQSVANIGSWHVDIVHDVLEWTDETYRIFGVRPGTPLTLEAFLDLVHPGDRKFVENTWRQALQGGPYDIEHRIVVNGVVKWVKERAEIEFDLQDRPVSALGTVQDITARKETENRIRYLAYYDSLTGLPNRQSFMERLDRELSRAKHQGYRLGVLFLDLDGFKSINDTLGHNVGDLILQWAAERMKFGIRPSDMLSRPGQDDEPEPDLARLGGDEFTVLLPRIQEPEDALMVAHRVRDLMHRPFVIEGKELVLTASIGIAIFPDDGQDGADLLKHADTAMYHAKDEGRDNCQFYSASLTTRAMQRMSMETNLRLALDRREFSLHYQPQVDARDGRIHALEALIRWRHPQLGMIPPADFIPLAEEIGLIVPIGEWVLRTACADAVTWRKEGRPAVRVAVNLSPLQFKDPNLVKVVLGILHETGLPADLLELEITEGALMEDTDRTLATLNALSEAGVHIALDDFGTGYSSLSYLKRMPLSRLKVDRSFVRELPEDSEDEAIVRAIIALANSLNFRVTAEGVETPDQAEHLLRLGCDSLQGYHFSTPRQLGEVAALLDQTWVTQQSSDQTA